MQKKTIGLLLVSGFVLSTWLGAVRLQGEIIHLGLNARTGGADAVVVEGVALAHTAQLLPVNSSGGLVGQGDAKAQIKQVFANLEEALSVGGSDLSRVIKLNVYVRNSGVTPAVVEVIGEEFSGFSKPAVSLVAGKLTHPDALVAMDAVATAPPRATYPVVRNRSQELPGEPGVSHVALLPVGPRVYISGQAAREGDVAQATRTTLEKLKMTLAFLGLMQDHVVHVKSFLKPMTATEEARKEIVEFFGSQAPPMTFVEWENANPIEIELIAMARMGVQSEGGMIEHITPPSENRSPVFSRVARLRHPKTIYFSGLFADGPGGAEQQIRQIFANLKFIAQQAGTDFDHLAKATYYVTNDEVSQQLNKIRPDFYHPERPPAASKAMVEGTGIDDLTVTLDMIAVPAK